MTKKKLPTLNTRGQAKQILARIRPAFRKHVQPHTKDQQGERLGGGSILNARWEHRLSRDLDIYLRLNTAEDARRLLDRAASACGGYRIEHPQFRRIEFTRNQDNHVDISFNTPKPEIGEHEAVVDNERAWVLSTPQIMSGKLQGRGLTSPARDLFDIAVCDKADPEALEIAVNALTEQYLNAILNIYKDTKEQYADEMTELEGIPKALEPIRNNPTEYASNAILNRKYERVIVRTNNGVAEIETRTLESSRTRMYEDATALQTGMERDGINLFLEAQYRDHNAVLNATVDQLWLKQNGTVIEIEPEPLKHQRVNVPTLTWKLEASHDDPRPGQAGPKTQPALGECPPNPETSPSRAAGFSASQERHRDRNNHER